MEMQADFGRRDSSRQLGLVWGTVAAALLALAPVAPRLLSSLPACPLKSVLDIPCLTCGTTRAALALARLEPWTALKINPLAAVGWTALVGGGLLAGLLALAGKPLAEPSWRLARPLRLALALLLVANWAYLVRAGI